MNGLTISIPEGLTRQSVIITELRGPMTRQIKEAALRDGGEEAWKALLQRVSEPCRQTFSRSLGTFEWIPAEHSKELSLTFMETATPEFVMLRGVVAAREQLTVVNRWLLKLMSPGFLVQNLPRLYDFYYRGGRVVVDELRPGAATVSLWADAFYPSWYAEGLPGWFSAALELTGARNIAICHLPPEDEGILAFRHVYDMRWQV